jgi:general secretion pathway protein G
MKRQKSGVRQAASAEAGFTLVELLVVLAIVALLAGLVGPRVVGYLGDARVKTTRLQIENIKTALELFSLDMGRYPTQDEGIKALAARPTSAESWRGPYLKDGGAPKDAWGHNFVYRVPTTGEPYEILSLGSDGKEGGEGDAADISSIKK